MSTIEELSGARLYKAIARLIKGSWLTQPQAIALMELIAEHVRKPITLGEKIDLVVDMWVEK